MDVSDPASPVELGFLDTPGLAWGVAVSGTVAYVADESALRMIDVSSPTTGGCCVNGTCAPRMSEASCLAFGGTFLGSGTSCAKASCPAACPSDINDDGVVDVDDLVQLILGWGVCP